MSKAMSVVYEGKIYPSVFSLFKQLGKSKNEYDKFIKWKDKNFLTSGLYSINDYVKHWLDGNVNNRWTYHGKNYRSFKDIFVDMNRTEKTEACRSWIFSHKDEFKDASTEEKIDAYFRMLSKRS